MAFFRRFAEGLGHSSRVAGLAEAAPTWGWEPVDGDPFESGLTDMVHDVARTLHGVPRSTSLGAGSSSAELGMTMFHDVYRGTVDGRAVTVANAWIDVEAVVAGGRHIEGNAIVAVELSTLLPIVGIEPRGRHKGIPGPEVSTGNASFDAAYRVVGIGSLAERPRDAGDATADRGPRRLGVRRRRDDVRRRSAVSRSPPWSRFHNG